MKKLLSFLLLWHFLYAHLWCLRRLQPVRALFCRVNKVLQAENLSLMIPVINSLMILSRPARDLFGKTRSNPPKSALTALHTKPPSTSAKGDFFHIFLVAKHFRAEKLLKSAKNLLRFHARLTPLHSHSALISPA